LRLSELLWCGCLACKKEQARTGRTTTGQKEQARTPAPQSQRLADADEIVRGFDFVADRRLFYLARRPKASSLPAADEELVDQSRMR
jgi:hypothetical protein